MSVQTVASRLHAKRPKVPPVVVLQMAEVVARGGIDDRDRMIRLLNARGWPATSIAVAARLTRKETVAILRQREIAQVEAPAPSDLDMAADLPAPEHHAQTARQKSLLRRKQNPFEGVPRDIIEKMLELKPMATAATGPTSAFADEANEFSRLMWLLKSPKEMGGYGLSYPKIAAALSLSPEAVRMRLIRYGYVKSKSSENPRHPGMKVHGGR